MSRKIFHWAGSAVDIIFIVYLDIEVPDRYICYASSDVLLDLEIKFLQHWDASPQLYIVLAFECSVDLQQ